MTRQKEAFLQEVLLNTEDFYREDQCPGVCMLSTEIYHKQQTWILFVCYSFYEVYKLSCTENPFH